MDLARLACAARFLVALACADAFAHHPGDHPVQALPWWQLTAAGAIAVAVVLGIGALRRRRRRGRGQSEEGNPER